MRAWTCMTTYSKNAVFVMTDYNLMLHNLHFITAHISFITVYLCSDNLLRQSLLMRDNGK